MIGTAGGQVGSFNFYRMFAGDGQGGLPSPASKGNKPMMITETAATIHVAVRGGRVPTNQSPTDRALIKQTWWRQLINSTFLETYPRIQAINFFEFFKFEETTFRDFTVFGGDGSLSSPGNPNDGTPQNGLTLKAMQEDLRGELGGLIQWAEPIGSTIVTTTVPQPTEKPKSSSKMLLPSLGLLLVISTFLF